MADHKKAPAFVTPKGIFVFPKLNEPDTKFKAEGEYSVKLRVTKDDPAVQALLAKLQPLHDKALENADKAFKDLPVKTRKGFEAKGVKGPVANPLFSDVYDDDENPTGDIELKFTMSASGVFKKGPKAGKTWTRKPSIFDAKGKVMDPAPGIWGGTIGKVSFEVGLHDGEPGYFIPGTAAAGLTLRLQAVQIIELVSAGGRSAAGYGFGEEEGYAYEPAAQESTAGS